MRQVIMFGPIVGSVIGSVDGAPVVVSVAWCDLALAVAGLVELLGE